MPTTAEFLVAFLEANPGAGLCAACLAAKIGAPTAEVQAAAQELAVSRHFTVEDARCARCGKPGALLRPPRPAAPA